MSHNRDLSAAAAQFGFHSSNIGIGSEAPRYPLDVHGGNLLVSGSAAGNLILEDRGVGDSSRPFALLASNDGNFTITSANRNASGTTTSSAERLRITSAGRIGINQTSPGAMLQVDYDEGNSEVGLRLRAYNASGSKTWQLSEINGNAGVFSIRNQTNSTEGLEIHADGHLRVPTGDLRVGDNTDANAGTQTISVGSISSGSGGIAIFANPTNGNSYVQFGDGTSSTDQYRGYMNYRHADDSLRFGTANTERMRLYANGKIHLGNSHIDSNNLTRLHVGWNTGGTVAGESIIAGTLGDGTTAVSALLTMKNAGNRGAKGASGGSSLAKFEFNNGTAFEVDKHGRRTLQYQPGFKCKLSAATGANFSGFLVFGNVSYNIGSHYNSSNGRFTAPVDGRYLFAWYTNMERAGGNGSIWADWYINGNAQGNRMYTHHSGAWELIGGTIIFDLNTNDYVQIYANTSGNWDGSQYGSYSGYLLG
jgi:hypothetical protein